MSALYGNWFWECRGNVLWRYPFARTFSWEHLWQLVMIERPKRERAAAGSATATSEKAPSNG